jgi:NADP-dependent 3-hydroxy acid dehydrogenase YdfG
MRELDGILECDEVVLITCISGLVKGVAQAPNIETADINVMLATNVTGLINMTQAVLPIFKKKDNGGRGDIINIGSIAGREPYAGGSIYCATKAAVRSFSDSLRKELISTRIRVIEVDPGQVETVRISFLFNRYDLLTLFFCRNFLLFASMATNPRLTPSTRMSPLDRAVMPMFDTNIPICSGVEPLTPDDIAEFIVFAAGRRENVVIADTLIYPNHQVNTLAFSILSLKFAYNYRAVPVLFTVKRKHENKRLEGYCLVMCILIHIRHTYMRTLNRTVYIPGKDCRYVAFTRLPSKGLLF